MDVSVILVSYNTIETTRKALDHLLTSTGDVSIEIVVVDNASRDGSADKIQMEYPSVRLIKNDKNVGFGRANNQALPHLSGKYILLVNTDAFVEQDTIAKTFRYMESHPECGILGVKLLGSDGMLQPSCRYFPTPWNVFLHRTNLKRFFTKTKLVDDMSWDHDSTRSCDWVPGCYYLVRKDVVDQIGLFDPRYFLYYEEVDHCFRAKSAGWQVTYFPQTPVIHIGGESATRDGVISSSSRQLDSLQIESEILYFRKNHGLLGVLEHMLLATLSDLMQFAKDLTRLRTPSIALSNLARIFQVWRTFLRTNFALRATR